MFHSYMTHVPSIVLDVLSLMICTLANWILLYYPIFFIPLLYWLVMLSIPF
jgi:hypothetical protein